MSADDPVNNSTLEAAQRLDSLLPQADSDWALYQAMMPGNVVIVRTLRYGGSISLVFSSKAAWSEVKKCLNL